MGEERGRGDIGRNIYVCIMCTRLRVYVYTRVHVSSGRVGRQRVAEAQEETRRRGRRDMNRMSG